LLEDEMHRWESYNHDLEALQELKE